MVVALGGALVAVPGLDGAVPVTVVADDGRAMPDGAVTGPVWPHAVTAAPSTSTAAPDSARRIVVEYTSAPLVRSRL
ncbi:hypothetical protein AXK58_22550 [Tsukamurella tyrosinosolvens]|nr:hypothetical protein AXK58_22550 [Tsukamurella tyrosinosolvens]KXP07017.1 hypothetical protein AXK59_02650 [Tsukamurella tyrosinosolvens]KZL98218.1 hypothetical protein AXX05_04800 [Tsukamurella tyrosinosolvens]